MRRRKGRWMCWDTLSRNEARWGLEGISGFAESRWLSSSLAIVVVIAANSRVEFILVEILTVILSRDDDDGDDGSGVGN